MGKSSLYHGCLCSAIVIDITLPLDPHLFNLGQAGQAPPQSRNLSQVQYQTPFKTASPTRTQSAKTAIGSILYEEP